MPGPAATVGSMHVCPMCSGTTPHVGGPISGPGVPTVLIGGKPAAVMGDMCTCVGPPDTIVQGCSTVLIGGKPAATVGDLTAHGGSITVGETTVLIGTGTSAPTAVMSIPKIPFPKITIKDRVGAAATGNSKKLKEAEANQDSLREEQQGAPRIYNLKWIKEENRVRDSKQFKEVTLRASVENIKDGETIHFKVKKPVADSNDKKFEDYVELSGTVNNKQVEVVWKVEVSQEEKNQEKPNTKQNQ